MKVPKTRIRELIILRNQKPRHVSNPSPFATHNPSPFATHSLSYSIPKCTAYACRVFRSIIAPPHTWTTITPSTSFNDSCPEYTTESAAPHAGSTKEKCQSFVMFVTCMSKQCTCDVCSALPFNDDLVYSTRGCKQCAWIWETQTYLKSGGRPRIVSTPRWRLCHSPQPVALSFY